MKYRRMLGISFLLALLAMSTMGYAKDKEKTQDAGRLLTGRVVDRQNNSVPGAVVYLSNTHTRAVKSYIIGQDGAYRFPALSLNIDYEVYAQYQGQKSDTKTVSQFDSRPQVNINLKLDLK
ncbi:MAG: carboxypeptidase regulatory-like domain-containing protein [Acidobacteriales bacterium]|nr:carboxypeptidase regulatory-like domain-containing protein [Terriglobales bacterium]